MNEKTEQIKAVMADEAFVQACVESQKSGNIWVTL